MVAVFWKKNSVVIHQKSGSLFLIYHAELLFCFFFSSRRRHTRYWRDWRFRRVLFRSLERLNPCFRERHVESSRPGELLSADTFMVGTLKGVGRVYLHAVVDTHGSHAFGFLHVSKQPEAAVAVLHNEVLPFYRGLGLPVGAVLTDNGREFCGTERHPYELYPALNDVEHRRTRVGTPRANGFVERFNGTALEEFFRPAMHRKLFESVEALQADLDAWLHHYNRERPRLGYRNQGRRPWETVERFVRQEG